MNITSKLLLEVGFIKIHYDHEPVIFQYSSQLFGYYIEIIYKGGGLWDCYMSKDSISINAILRTTDEFDFVADNLSINFRFNKDNNYDELKIIYSEKMSLENASDEHYLITDYSVKDGQGVVYNKNYKVFWSSEVYETLIKKQTNLTIIEFQDYNNCKREVSSCISQIYDKKQMIS